MTIRRRPPQTPPPRFGACVAMTPQQQRRQDLQCEWLQRAIDARDSPPELDRQLHDAAERPQRGAAPRR